MALLVTAPIIWSAPNPWQLLALAFLAGTLVDLDHFLAAEQRYYPYGEVRWITGTLPTDLQFTGQRRDDHTALIHMGARWYDARLGRWTSADTIVPGFADPQNLNRYSYVRNNPVRYTDPSGHFIFEEEPDDPYVWPVSSRPTDTIIRGANHDSFADKSQWSDPPVLLPVAAIYGSAVLATGGEIAVDVVGSGWAAIRAAARTILTAELADGDDDEVRLAQRGLDTFSRAAEFGIRSCKQLRTMIEGTGLQAHHIVEQRFARTLGINPEQMPSVALTPDEHQVLTNAWRQLIGYSNSTNPVNTITATAQDVWSAAQEIYAAYPDLLEAARQTVFGPPGG